MRLFLIPLVNHKEKTYFFSLNIAQFSSMSKVATDNASLKSWAELNDALGRLYCTSYQYPCILYPFWCQMLFTLTRPLWFDPNDTNETVAGFQDSIVVFLLLAPHSLKVWQGRPCHVAEVALFQHTEKILFQTHLNSKKSVKGAGTGLAMIPM